MKGKITVLRQEQLVQVVFIDSLDGYYQHIPSSAGQRITSLYELVREMDILAKSLHIIIFMNMTNDNNLWPSKEVQIALSAADYLLHISHMEEIRDINKRCISVSIKNKGDIGSAIVMFNRRRDRFYNFDDVLNDEPPVPEE